MYRQSAHLGLSLSILNSLGIITLGCSEKFLNPISTLISIHQRLNQVCCSIFNINLLLRFNIPHTSLSDLFGPVTLTPKREVRILKVTRKEYFEHLSILLHIERTVATSIYGTCFWSHGGYKNLRRKSLSILDYKKGNLLKAFLFSKNRINNSAHTTQNPAVVTDNDVTLSPSATRLLSHGRKFVPPLVMKDYEILDMTRKVASGIKANNREAFINSCLQKEFMKNRKLLSVAKEFKSSITDTEKELIEKDLRILLGDKDGKFGIITERSFKEKKTQALSKNFNQLPK